jgi:hypothetical protein
LNKNVVQLQNKVFIYKIGLPVKNVFTDKIPRKSEKVRFGLKMGLFDLLINYREKLESFNVKSATDFTFWTLFLTFIPRFNEFSPNTAKYIE